MYFVYMLLTNKDTIYTGIAKDVEKRFNEHINGIKAKGAKYTNANKPIKILYSLFISIPPLFAKYKVNNKH